MVAKSSMAQLGTIALDSNSTMGSCEARIEDLQTQSNSGHHGLCGSFVSDPPAKAERGMVLPSNQHAPRYRRLSITPTSHVGSITNVAGTRLWLSRDRLCDLGMDDCGDVRCSKTSRVQVEGVTSAPCRRRRHMLQCLGEPGEPSGRSGRFTTIGVFMRIVIDLNRCLGYAQCVPLAPEVLRLSGEEALTYDPNPDDSQRVRVLRAAASCPVQAIIVEQLDE
jgi:ferredoxin